MQGYSEAFGETVKDYARINAPEFDAAFGLTYDEGSGEWYWQLIKQIEADEL